MSKQLTSISSYYDSSVQLYPTLCDPMDCSTPGLLVHHQLPEFTHTHIHWVGDAIQPSHPLESPSPAFNLSQHQGLFKWVSSSHQYYSFSFSISPSNEYSRLVSFRIDWLYLLAVQGTQESATSQLKSINSSALSFLYSPTLISIYDYWKNHSTGYSSYLWIWEFIIALEYHKYTAASGCCLAHLYGARI